MAALADTFHDQIKTQALDKGAQRVALLNMPNVLNTPRFQAALAEFGAVSGAAARAQSEALIKAWIETFNTRLAARVSGNSAITLVDFHALLNDEIAKPSQFGLSNVTHAACPAAGSGSDGLPSYNFATCTAAALSGRTPPAGASGGADWWKSYAFADGFHPTPHGHQLLAQLITRTLTQAGWL
jgi:outer membrane lipase/esterase